MWGWGKSFVHHRSKSETELASRECFSFFFLSFFKTSVYYLCMRTLRLVVRKPLRVVFAVSTWSVPPPIGLKQRVLLRRRCGLMYFVNLYLEVKC